MGDFFLFNWQTLITSSRGKILVLGNFPWVTNSQQGTIEGKNLPKKSNFQGHSGLEAITGKSNFDISEWMLIKVIHCLQNREGYLAMLCKTSVSRKILNYIHSNKLNLAYCATYKIDSKKYFDASVESCLLICKFDLDSKNYFCHVFDNLDSLDFYQISYQNNILVKDSSSFAKLNNFDNTNTRMKWRSGIKHDCAKIMEFSKKDDYFINGLGEKCDLEENYFFPLMKGSDVAQNRINTIEKYMLVTQKFVGEPTDSIREIAPKTWNYLKDHANFLERRKSKIYHNNPQFSIFGVGLYTFSSWKIAICGLYKKLDFRLIPPIMNQTIVFDDTVYFLSFDDEKTAYKGFEILTSSPVIEFYSSLIFWDDKRPIKSSILNRLNLTALL